MFKKPQKLVLQNPPGFCDSSSSLVSDSEDISSVTVGDPESNPSTVGNSESISSSSVTVVSDSEVNSLLPVNASPGNLPVTVANVPDSAPSSRSASLVSNSEDDHNIKLPKASILEKWKKKHEWLVITERNTMICKVYVSQKDKIFLKNPSSAMAFINGSVAFKKSALNEHASLECHDTGIAEVKDEQGHAAGK